MIHGRALSVSATPFMRGWLLVPWLIGIGPAAFVALGIVSERTFGTRGTWHVPTVASMGHSHPTLVLLFVGLYLLMALWLLIAWVLLLRQSVRQRTSARSWLVVVATTVIVISPLAPAAVVEAPFVLLFGPGREPGNFLFAAGGLSSRFLVRAVRARGGDINAAGDAGVTALGAAAGRGDSAFVEWLLQQGAQVDPRSELGFTPLMAAVSEGHREVVQLLLKHGADPHASTTDGTTVLQIALEAGDSGIVDEIRRALKVKLTSARRRSPVTRGAIG